MVSKFCFTCYSACHLKLCDLSLLYAPLEEGDGNRIVTLVIETLANVLEKKFDEGWKELGIWMDSGSWQHSDRELTDGQTGKTPTKLASNQ